MLQCRIVIRIGWSYYIKLWSRFILNIFTLDKYITEGTYFSIRVMPFVKKIIIHSFIGPQLGNMNRRHCRSSARTCKCLTVGVCVPGWNLWTWIKLNHVIALGINLCVFDMRIYFGRQCLLHLMCLFCDRNAKRFIFCN